MKHIILIVSLFVVGCGASHGFGEDAGDDADPSADASDDHKLGFKPDSGSDADPGSDASDGGTVNDASDSGSTTGTKRVFTTAPNEYYIGTTTGKFQGLAGADAICQNRANTANLGGTWRAWLSSSTVSAAQRLTHSTGPYQLIDGTPIANDWTELTSGTLQNKISENELAQTWTSAVTWTSTNPDGTAIASATCADFTVASSSVTVNYGINDYVNGRWTKELITTTCADHMGFYCIEQ